MANLAASAVTVNSTWVEGAINGKRHVCKDVTLVLTGQGGGTNLIPAAVLGLRTIEQVGCGITSDNAHMVVGSPAYDGSSLLLKASATDAPTDLTATLRLIVKGLPRVTQ